VAARIAVLDDALADQIAAGEVVERPASVVKELLENALDAGATRISVEIADGGCGQIRVVDDGTGMSPEDAQLSVRRHATSKLRRIEDLALLATLGFRGEALPSIASVSRFTLTTREEGALAATRVEIEAAGEPRVSEVGAPRGTAIEVRDLFWNVPARLKFLKARPTENGHIATVCLRTAIAHPSLALSLHTDGRRTRSWLPVSSFGERVQSAFPDEPLNAFETTRDGMRLQLALSAPERARSGATGLHLFVNGRPVRDAALARAVAYAYGSVLPPGRYPVGALALWLPPEQVDVNVHPQKLEVRFRDGRAVLDTVTRAIARQLGTAAWGGPAQRSASYWDERLRGMEPTQARDAAGVGAQASLHAVAPIGEGDPWGLGAATPPGAASGEPFADAAVAGVAEATDASGARDRTGPSQQTLTPRGFFGSLRVLGQVRKMLLICEGDDALYILDQHAADERVRYDHLRRAYAERRVETQRLLFPERVSCTEVEAALVESQHEALHAVGVECSVLGPGTLAVHAVPALLRRARPERLIRDLLAELERAGGRNFSAAIDRAIATMACHGAIRAGDALPIEQAEALLRNLDGVQDFAGHCPHGRPVVHSVPLDTLEHKLGR
jgi:DNA mismatch repair protein MutL